MKGKVNLSHEYSFKGKPTMISYFQFQSFTTNIKKKSENISKKQPKFEFNSSDLLLTTDSTYLEPSSLKNGQNTKRKSKQIPKNGENEIFSYKNGAGVQKEQNMQDYGINFDDNDIQNPIVVKSTKKSTKNVKTKLNGAHSLKLNGNHENMSNIEENFENFNENKYLNGENPKINHINGIHNNNDNNLNENNNKKLKNNKINKNNNLELEKENITEEKMEKVGVKIIAKKKKIVENFIPLTFSAKLTSISSTPLSIIAKPTIHLPIPLSYPSRPSKRKDNL